MHHNRRGFVRMSGAAAALATFGLSVRAGAQGGQPLEVVKIVTGFPIGGTSDTLCWPHRTGMLLDLGFSRR